MASAVGRYVLRSTLLSMVSLVFVGSTQLLFSAAMGRSFGADVLGQVIKALSVALLLSPLLSSSLVQANTKFVAEHRGRKDEERAGLVFTHTGMLVLVGGLGLIALVAAFRTRVAAAAGIDEQLLLLALPIVLLHPAYLLMKGMYYACERVPEYLRLEAVTAGVFLATLAAVVWGGAPYLSPFILSYAFFSLGGLGAFRDRLAGGLHRSREVLEEVLRFSGFNILGQFLNLARQRLSVLLPALYLTDAQIGLYAAAFALQSVFYLVPKSLGIVISPTVSYSYGSARDGDVNRLLSASARHITIYITLASGACIFAAPWILTLVYTGAFAGATMALRLLILATTCAIISIPASYTLQATRYVWVLSIAGLAGLVTSVGVWLWVLPAAGIDGVAAGFLAGSFVNALVSLVAATRYFDFSLAPLARTLLVGCACAALGAGAELVIPTNGLLGAAVFSVAFAAVNRADIERLARRVRDAVGAPDVAACEEDGPEKVRGAKE